MTKNEFILNAMLQMAANPKYVGIEPSDDDPEVMYQSLNVECIFIDAEALANEAEKRLDNPFNEISDSNLIAEKLGEIEEEMEREYDNDHMDD